MGGLLKYRCSICANFFDNREDARACHKLQEPIYSKETETKSKAELGKPLEQNSARSMAPVEMEMDPRPRVIN